MMSRNTKEIGLAASMADQTGMVRRPQTTLGSPKHGEAINTHLKTMTSGGMGTKWQGHFPTH